MTKRNVIAATERRGRNEGRREKNYKGITENKRDGSQRKNVRKKQREKAMDKTKARNI